jgi:hypothetical protein
MTTTVAPIAPSAASGAAAVPQTSQAKDTARNQLTQLVGKLADDSGTQSAAVVAAINAIAAAINAKPSA